MSQRDLSELVGTLNHQQVSKHERSTIIPSLVTALSYHLVFSVPIAELFPGLYETISINIEEHVRELEKKLQGSPAKGRAAHIIARKLEWLWERQHSADQASAT
jgi:hypothetical protein